MQSIMDFTCKHCHEFLPIEYLCNSMSIYTLQRLSSYASAMSICIHLPHLAAANTMWSHSYSCALHVTGHSLSC